MPPRKPKNWEAEQLPALLPVTGHHDTTTRITYLPFSDVQLGLMGWRVVPHLGRNFLVYMTPVIGEYTCEIRVHAANEEPDPDEDRIIGTITLPDDLIHPQD